MVCHYGIPQQEPNERKRTTMSNAPTITTKDRNFTAKVVGVGYDKDNKKVVRLFSQEYGVIQRPLIPGLRANMEVSVTGRYTPPKGNYQAGWFYEINLVSEDMFACELPAPAKHDDATDLPM